jgi:predicted amino acid racemase
VFLDSLLTRNEALVEAAIRLHREDAIPPGAFCIDLDTVERNAAVLADAAAGHHIRLFFMTKQVGRNPAFAQSVRNHVPAAVAVDSDDADCLAATGIPLGHVGHLVQPARSAVARLVGYRPEFVTVFSVEKALEVAAAARDHGLTQSLLLRVTDDRDELFPGQEGGIPLAELGTVRAAIDETDGVRVAGITSYPTAKFVDGRYVETGNLETLRRAAEELGDVEHVNAAGHTSVDVLPIVAAAGATQAEPGHALTGTTPRAATAQTEEVPAVCFLTEVSHLDADHVHVFGGGFYERGHAREGLVATSSGGRHRLPLVPLGPTAIDYYRRLECHVDGIEVGDPAVFAFRFQVFTSRARVAALEGVQAGRPRLLGVWDSYGRPVTTLTQQVASPLGS